MYIIYILTDISGLIVYFVTAAYGASLLPLVGCGFL